MHIEPSVPVTGPQSSTPCDSLDTYFENATCSMKCTVLHSPARGDVYLFFPTRQLYIFITYNHPPAPTIILNILTVSQETDPKI